MNIFSHLFEGTEFISIYSIFLMIHYWLFLLACFTIDLIHSLRYNMDGWITFELLFLCLCNIFF